MFDFSHSHFFFLEYHPNVTETSRNTLFSVLFYLGGFSLSTIRCFFIPVLPLKNRLILLLKTNRYISLNYVLILLKPDTGSAFSLPKESETDTCCTQHYKKCFAYLREISCLWGDRLLWFCRMCGWLRRLRIYRF